MFTFNSAPITITKFQPQLEDHEKQRVKSVRLWVDINRSSAFQSELFGVDDANLNELEAMLWDEQENKRTGVKEVAYDREFTNVDLEFVENGSPRVKLERAKVEKIKAKPITGKTLAIKFQVLAIVSDGQLDQLHDILRHPAVTLNAEERPPLEAVA